MHGGKAKKVRRELSAVIGEHERVNGEAAILDPAELALYFGVPAKWMRRNLRPYRVDEQEVPA